MLVYCVLGSHPIYNQVNSYHVCIHRSTLKQKAAEVSNTVRLSSVQCSGGNPWHKPFTIHCSRGTGTLWQSPQQDNMYWLVVVCPVKVGIFRFYPIGIWGILSTLLLLMPCPLSWAVLLPWGGFLCLKQYISGFYECDKTWGFPDCYIWQQVFAPPMLGVYIPFAPWHVLQTSANLSLLLLCY